MDDDIRILLIEDDEVDVELVRRNFKKSNLPAELVVARNGEEGLIRLRELIQASSFELRIVVLLDINMPKMNGHQFLQALRDDPIMKVVVVFVLTTSESLQDTQAAYDKNVAGYLIKGQFDKTADGLSNLILNYFERNTFPPRV